MDIEEADKALINAAREVIRNRYRPGWHAVGCALRTRSGRVYRGIHLECSVGRIAVCAEAIAIGTAASADGDTDIDTIVAVRQSGPDDKVPAIVAPCGMCREMISDYAPNARVIMPGKPNPRIRTIAELLPGKYKRS